MEEIKAFVKTQKPEISEKTLTGYASNLRLLYKSIFPEDKSFDVDKLLSKDVNEYIEFVKSQNKSSSYVRNMLSALQVVFKNKELTKAITKNSEEEKVVAENQEATPYIKSHHITQEQIDQRYEELKNEVEPIWTKPDWNMDDFQKLQQYIMYCLVCGKFLAPRRSRDWYDFKLRNIDLDKDNYLDGKVLVFNSYKNFKNKGQQRVQCPPELYRILRKWIRFNKLPWLLVNVKLEPLTAVSYGQKLNNIMGVPSGRTAGFSTNNWRHVYLTNKYSNTLDLKQDMKNMGSSIGVAHHYIKKI
jgi:hypothetical protein